MDTSLQWLVNQLISVEENTSRKSLPRHSSRKQYHHIYNITATQDRSTQPCTELDATYETIKERKIVIGKKAMITTAKNLELQESMSMADSNGSIIQSIK
ncbi:hypothetical protein SAY87_004291 [Trapa incisa]|uniref:Uncharacterized protein n=1 Tax=Trapa incisa TaxID=236973 RepID=A0AAN7JNQ6_9MYRT|nr:hypothetical protein SAY87_004291 [Trapa incisa]